jgi:hypothetical protein
MDTFKSQEALARPAEIYSRVDVLENADRFLLHAVRYSDPDIDSFLAEDARSTQVAAVEVQPRTLASVPNAPAVRTAIAETSRLSQESSDLQANELAEHRARIAELHDGENQPVDQADYIKKLTAEESDHAAAA